jgi:hypothetical protein
MLVTIPLDQLKTMRQSPQLLSPPVWVDGPPGRMFRLQFAEFDTGRKYRVCGDCETMWHDTEAEAWAEVQRIYTYGG